MRKILCCGATALLLIGSGWAMAQEPSPAEATRQSLPAQPEKPGAVSAPDHTIPPPPHAQPQAPLADQAKPAAVGPAQANTANAMPEQVPGADRQTMPSTISAANAAQDKLPTIAFQFPLTAEQKKLIAAAVAQAPKTQTTADLGKLKVADQLPNEVEMQDFPQ